MLSTIYNGNTISFDVESIQQNQTAFSQYVQTLIDNQNIDTLSICVHDGLFHCDDIFATAILSLGLQMAPKKQAITRTRDAAIIDTSNFKLDVGGQYNPSTGYLDHHHKKWVWSRMDYRTS